MENILCSSSGSRSCDACSEERKSEVNKEIALAEMFCKNCKEKLCTECCNQHKKFKLTKAHKFIALGELQTDQGSIKDRLVPNACDLHDQALNTYCKDCKAVVCSACFVDKHKGHDGSLFKRIGDEFREKLQRRVDSLFTCASAAQVRKANLEMEKNRILETMTGMEEKIITRRDNVKKLADHHAQDLLQTLDSLKQTRLKEIQTATDYADSHLKSLGSYSLYCKDIIARGSYSDICRSVNGLISKGDSLQQQNLEILDAQIGDLHVLYFESNLEQLFQNECQNVLGSIAVNRSKDLHQTLESQKKDTEQLRYQPQTSEVDENRSGVTDKTRTTKLPALCPTLRTVCSLPCEVDRSSLLHCLPEEIFLKILRLVRPLELIRNGRLVCRYWLQIIDSNAFWRKMCEEKGVEFTRIDTSYASNTLTIDFRSIYLNKPFHRNLVKNWNAADGFNHWTILENGGDRFKVEPDSCTYSNPVSSINVSGCSNCWVTSFGWCTKFQLIDLLDEGCTQEILDQLKPMITISEWTAARYDCGSEYLLHVTLESSNGKVLDLLESKRIVGQWEDRSWKQVMHKFRNYPVGVRYVRVVHGGKDRQYWAGHYGPKITATSVLVSLEN